MAEAAPRSVPLPDLAAWHHAKVAFLLPPGDRSRLLGLEIGARDAPLLRRADGPVLFADVMDAASLRANRKRGLDPARIIEVDVVTGGRPLAAVLDTKVDYIVASHVAEHVPDLLGWFADLAAVLAPGGQIGMAVPDRRFTFDLFRRESTIAEAVEAHLAAYTRPSLRQIHDCAWQAVTVDVTEAWTRPLPARLTEAAREARLEPALGLVRGVAAEDRYNDSHCWVFTAASFLALLRQAALCDLFRLRIARFMPPPPGGYEFLVVLEDAAGGRPAVLESIAAAEHALASSPGEATWQALTEDPGMASLRAELAHARAALAAMQAARLWRITAPLRRLVDRFRPRTA